MLSPLIKYVPNKQNLIKNYSISNGLSARRSVVSQAYVFTDTHTHTGNNSRRKVVLTRQNNFKSQNKIINEGAVQLHSGCFVCFNVIVLFFSISTPSNSFHFLSLLRR